MKNATYFLRLFEHLNLENQKNFLRNIFSLQFVSEYNISIVKDSIIFDLYVSNVFYRFIFRLKRDDSKFYVLKKEMDRIKIFIIWVKNYGQSLEKYSFDILSNVFLNGDNGEVDSLFSNLFHISSPVIPV